jgi:hypothetical protein
MAWPCSSTPGSIKASQASGAGNSLHRSVAVLSTESVKGRGSSGVSPMVATPARSVLEDFVQFGQLRVVGPLRSATEDVRDCDVVLAAAGDTPTLEIVAATWLLRKHAPTLKVRVVNVVDCASFLELSTRTVWRRPSSLNSSPPPSRSSSVSMAINERCTRSSMGGLTPSGSTCADSWRKGQRPRHSTWSS